MLYTIVTCMHKTQSSLLQIVKELLVKESSEQTSETIEGDWCREDQLPEETRCRLEGLKCMARWLLGLKSDVLSAQKTFRMLNAFMVNKGDLLSQGRLSKAEMSWLRLQAGCSMLKICEQKGVGDQFTAEQFYNLSQLMVVCFIQTHLLTFNIIKKNFLIVINKICLIVLIYRMKFLKSEKHLVVNCTKDLGEESPTNVCH